MKLQPIVYVTDVARAVNFYKLLGLTETASPPSSMWAELRFGDARLGIHNLDRVTVPTGGRVSLNFITDEPLETVVKRLDTAGADIARAIADEAFGRSLVVRDPDGLLIQINEHDPELYQG